MKHLRIIALLFFAALCFRTPASAAPGDTLVVQAFTFGSKQDSTFIFPSDTGHYQRVLMYYTLKCNPKQSPACGEWDYLTYTYLYQGQERYELGRYITPYGINLSLGDGFTWVFDVTDYLPLLHDNVRLAAGNWQELLDMKFLFIKGTPARKPYKVENVWNGTPAYGTSNSIESFLSAKSITIDPKAASTRMKVRVTGHGMGGTDNCAEFCPKQHSLTVNGNETWRKLVWRDNCALNPVYPQGGTWVYQRANWCPGAEVETYDIELTPKVTAGAAAELDYNVEPYTWNGAGSQPYYAIETQMIYYEPAAFSLDATVEAIISPSRMQMYGRMNPGCSRPVVVIRNTGTTPLTKLHIKYGVEGVTSEEMIWEGNLAFLEADTVTLNTVPWTGSDKQPVFKVEVFKPNEGQDQYAGNNVAYSLISQVPTIKSQFVVQMRTNNRPEENSWTITDVDGKVVASSKPNLQPNTMYRDTVTLPYSCYTLRLEDKGEDGLSFWANQDAGSGLFRMMGMDGKIIKLWNADFGKEIFYAFTTGYSMNVPEVKPEPEIVAYPNPTRSQITVDLTTWEKEPLHLTLTDIQGRILHSEYVSRPDAGLLNISIEKYPAGIYILQARGKNGMMQVRVVKE